MYWLLFVYVNPTVSWRLSMEPHAREKVSSMTLLRDKRVDNYFFNSIKRFN